MRITVTGADGMLGSNVVRRLLSSNHTVRVFIHPSSKSKSLDGLNVERVNGDLLNFDSVAEALEGQDAVVHAAALTTVWPQRAEIIRKVNIEGTRNIIEAVKQHKLKRMVYVGSASAADESGVVRETENLGARFGLDYIDSKYEALALMRKEARESGVPAVGILPTFMLGAYDSLPGSGKMIQSLGSGKLRFYSSGGKNFVCVTDVALAIERALTKGTPGESFVVGGENLTFAEFLTKAAGIMEVPAPKGPLPNGLVKSAGFLMEGIAKITGGTPMMSRTLAGIACEKVYTTGKFAWEAFDFEPTPVEDGIKACHDWFTANNYYNK